ncbi:MAG TPA: hypothetical protein PKD99_06620 [Sphingopyxis sp.]|nr:hypothetical protein [Sphingopyxis sp.]HMP44763.1 hypothetical protein [Sphingopyxis sp.]HMQ20642.1 hypothetical protein [Sphingopyxis sp.]
MGIFQRCVANCDALRARKAKLEQYQKEAALAAAVYNKNGEMDPGGTVPRGFERVTDDAELEKIGLSNKLLTPPGYQPDGNNAPFAAVFKDQDSGAYSVVFKGTSSGADWKVNAGQGLGNETSYYSQAEIIGKNVAMSDGGNNVKFVGHSLGGGLASAASRASGMPATTFNAAGLHPNTIADPRASQIDAVYVRGELLRGAQMTPGVRQAVGTKVPLDPPAGIGSRVAKWIARTSIAAGHPWLGLGVAAVRGFFLHGMDAVVPAVDQEKANVDKEIAECC